MNTNLVEKRDLENKVAEMTAKIKNLQQELDDSVAVQTHFVRLSQSLQIELEKIRQGEKEVCILFLVQNTYRIYSRIIRLIPSQ